MGLAGNYLFDLLLSIPLRPQACFNGHADVAALFIERGADTVARNRNLLTPLHYAASNGELRSRAMPAARVASRAARGRTSTTEGTTSVPGVRDSPLTPLCAASPQAT